MAANVLARRADKPDVQYKTATRVACVAVAMLLGISVAADQTPSNVLPGTRPEAFTTIRGQATTSSNSPFVDGSVRLRDARLGRIVDTVKPDASGQFAFP